MGSSAMQTLQLAVPPVGGQPGDFLAVAEAGVDRYLAHKQDALSAEAGEKHFIVGHAFASSLVLQSLYTPKG